MQRKLVYAIFWDARQAREAVEALSEAHFSKDDIGVLLSQDNEEGIAEFPIASQTQVPKAAAVGGTIGAIGGAVALVASGLIAAGPLVAALEGALVGGWAGGLTGALGGMGYWTEEIEAPEEELKEGAILVGAATTERIDAASQALIDVGAEEVHVRTRHQAEDELDAS